MRISSYNIKFYRTEEKDRKVDYSTVNYQLHKKDRSRIPSKASNPDEKCKRVTK